MSSNTGGKLIDGFIRMKLEEVVIAGGIVTATQSRFCVDTEAAAADDDLDTINGGKVGAIIFLEIKDSARNVTVKDGVGNINLAGSVDFVMGTTRDRLVLVTGNGTAWFEVSRSTN